MTLEKSLVKTFMLDPAQNTWKNCPTNCTKILHGNHHLQKFSRHWSWLESTSRACIIPLSFSNCPSETEENLSLSLLNLRGSFLLPTGTAGYVSRFSVLRCAVFNLGIPPLFNLHVIPFWNQEGHRNWMERWNPPLRIWNLGILESWNLGMEQIDFIYLQHVWYLFGIRKGTEIEWNNGIPP